MRVTSSMYYSNLYSNTNTSLQTQLFDVNKQIASGLQIQYAKDNVRTFAETMKLDNETTQLDQISKSANNGYKLSNQTDVIMNDFDSTMSRMRVLLVKAANGSNSVTSLDAIAAELKTIKEHFRNLANSSINGQYLFSGSAVDTKPIDANGHYQGNDVALKSFTGSSTKQQYNITGKELFLGEKHLVKREVTSNVVNKNLVNAFPVGETKGKAGVVTKDSTIRELMGDTDAANPGVANHYFYLRGTDSSGRSFKKTITMSDEQPISSLMHEIENAYGAGTVDVSLNKYGEFVIQDKIKGSSKIQFNMVGAVDFNLTDGNDLANINDPSYAKSGLITNLDGGETNFNNFVTGTTPPGLFVKEFVKSKLDPATSISSLKIDGLEYDRTEFTREGSVVSSNVPQIVKKSRIVGSTEMIAVADRNKFATDSTLLVDVASGSLNGSSMKLEGLTSTGTPLNVNINFSAGGSTFTDNNTGKTYNIYNMSNPRVAADGDKMKYRQLMDVMNMAITGNFPLGSPGTDTQYDEAISTANAAGEVSLGYDGKIKFQDKQNSNTPAKFAMYDTNSGKFSAPASLMTFNTNNAITVRDPKTDFFNEIDQMITAVENHKLYPDSTSANMRNIGIENAIAMMDDLTDHVLRAHAQSGAQSTALQSEIERTSVLKISVKTLRSSVIDTDLAKASLSLSQLTTDYKAMLSIVGKVSKLNLVNYL